MNTAPAARKAFLSALLTLVALTGVLLALSSPASANKEDCPPGKVCLWSGPTFGGEIRAFFNGEEVGCHSLENINPRSAFNHTGNHLAIFPEFITLGPGRSWENAPEPGWQFNMCIR
jgi:peptidase inhibitor family I36